MKLIASAYLSGRGMLSGMTSQVVVVNTAVIGSTNGDGDTVFEPECSACPAAHQNYSHPNSWKKDPNCEGDNCERYDMKLLLDYQNNGEWYL